MQSIKCFFCRKRLNFTRLTVSSTASININNKPILLKHESPKNFFPFAGFYNVRSSNILRNYSTSPAEDLVDANTFETACEETLDSLTEFFEELIESEDKLAAADVSYSDGVLTVNLGKFGTYVINRQSPNRQIWLSSPLSGPKRYDYITDRKAWIYKHDNKSLFELLEKEISDICGRKVDFSKCLHT